MSYDIIFTKCVKKLSSFINEQASDNVNNVNMSRYNHDKDKLDTTIKYAVEISYKFLNEVINNNYYPLLDDKQLIHIISNRIIYACLNLFYPYLMDNTIIHKLQTLLTSKLELYYAETCTLYLNDEDALHHHITNYLADLWLNIY